MSQKEKYWAILPAAGIGQRMGSQIPKQYLRLADKAVIEHSLQALLDCEQIQQIVVCIAQNDTHWRSLKISQHQQVQTVNGGETRAVSVVNGLLALAELADDNDWVLVHDAARPCLSSILVDSLVEQLKNDSVGGILAVPAVDTIKQATAENKISQTLDRALIWQAQTPQMFRYGLLKSALRQALEQGLEISDEASAIEQVGFSPQLVEGATSNLKITTADDLRLAEFLLKAE